MLSRIKDVLSTGITSSANLSREIIDRSYCGDTCPPKSCKIMQATRVLFHPRSHPTPYARLGTRLSLFPRHFLSALGFFRVRDNLQLECVFHRQIVTQHIYAVVCFFGNSPRNRRSLTFTLGAFPNANQPFRYLFYSIDSGRSSNVYLISIKF